MKAKAFLVDSLKMSSTFSWYFAEHSRYRSAFICCRVASPCNHQNREPALVTVIIDGTVYHFSSWFACFFSNCPLFWCKYILSYLHVCNGVLVQGLELSCALFVLSEVGLTANQDDRNLPAEVPHLWEPLEERSGVRGSQFVFFPSRWHLVVEFHSWSYRLLCFTVLILSVQT